MRVLPFRPSSIVFFTGLLLLTSGCGGPDLTNRNTAPAANIETKPAELELSGIYTVSGSGDNNANPYDGVLTITNDNAVYQFKWQTTRPKPGGFGVQMGDALAVSYADSSSGKGCGVAVYRIASDGSLDGRVVRWGENTYGTEKALKVGGGNFDGQYKFTGTSNDGKPYEGTIDVAKSGKGYSFTWNAGGKELFGFGIWRGDRAAVGFGGKQCSFGIYKVVSARTLEGHWGSQRDVVFGTENAKRP